jgi:diguanylate cyclase (GGDEF)-like protein/PAS domain S-box-containing protein
MFESITPSIHGAKVLVVDDTPANITILKLILEEQGYQVLAATSGERALAIVAQTRPDLIVLDVMMPGMDGLETCRQLKGRTESKDIPVIFVTALTDMKDLLVGFQVGAVDYIHKPFRHEEVCARVRTHLQNCTYLAAYREEAERLRTMINAMGEGLLWVTPDGKIRGVNPAALLMLGSTEQEVVGRLIYELLASPFKEEYEQYFQSPGTPHGRLETLRYGPQEVQMQNASMDRLDLSISEVFSGEPMFVALLHDISAHRRTQEELLRTSWTDPLTGVSNRRHLDHFLAQEWARSQRNAAPISLAIFDIDFFKRYNDALGHPAGDVCLQKVAQAIKHSAKRPTDLAVRFGGEEFVVVYAETDLDVAHTLAADACRAIEAMGLPHPASSVASSVTISGGVACLRADIGEPAQSLIVAADAALYYAKEQGRNRVERSR